MGLRLRSMVFRVIIIQSHSISRSLEYGFILSTKYKYIGLLGSQVTCVLDLMRARVYLAYYESYRDWKCLAKKSILYFGVVSSYGHAFKVTRIDKARKFKFKRQWKEGV